MIAIGPISWRGGRIGPFHWGPKLIQDLKAQEIGLAAIKVLQSSGRTNLSLRLLYRTLELNPFHPEALLTLIALYRGNSHGARPTGDQILSGIIVEYAMDPKSGIPADKKRLFDKTRLEIMTGWGFSKSRGEESELDHIGYMSYINELMSKVRSVSNGFKLGLMKLGIEAQAIDSKGTYTKNYQDWLHADASILQH